MTMAGGRRYGRDVDVGGRVSNMIDQASRAVSGTSDEMVQLSGRTDGDLIVFMETHASAATELIGSIVPVKITSADRLSLHGEMV